MTPIAPRASERVLATMEPDGSRRWLTPRLAHGRLLERRRAVAYGLIALLTALPLVPINGKPAVLLDVPNRQFTLLGYTFLPTDTVLLALLVLAWFGLIFLTTAVAGRAWCGWACPQTVYLEFVYRPIERLCLGRRGVGGRPKDGVSLFRKLAMHLVFLLVSLAITHTLLSYFVGVEQLWRWVASSPARHPWAFGVIVLSTAGVWYNFVFFREQMCTFACPYGRFQSVLFDRHSLGVRYLEPRGEPRTKLSAAKRATVSLPTCESASAKSTQDCSGCPSRKPGCPGPTAAASLPAQGGDCIDCNLCVQVCPTGIDIRNGVQLECVNCTQCIDACDSVMRKIGRPEGLIGFYSQENLEGRKSRLVRPRVVLYAAVTFGFTAVLLLLILTKQPFDASLGRNIGLPFIVTPSGEVENTMRLTLRNRSGTSQTFTVLSATPGVTLVGDTARFSVPAGESVMRPVNVVVDRAAFHDGTTHATVIIENNDGVRRAVKYQVFGPGQSK